MNEESDDLYERVEDPEQYSRKQRIKQIHEARERVPQTRGRATRLNLEHQIRDEDVLTAIRRAVEDYIMEVRPLLSEHENGSYYWEDCELGTIQLAPLASPPADAVPVRELDGTRLEMAQDALARRPPNAVPVTGLSSITNLPNPIRRYTAAKVDPRQGAPYTVYREQRARVPEHVLMEAYAAVNDFIRDADLDLQFKQSDDAEYDYSDLLENGPPDSDPASASTGGD